MVVPSPAAGRDAGQASRGQWRDPAVFVATCGWIGRVPFAPGTFGSLAGVPLSLAAAALAGRLGDRLGSPVPAVEAAVLAVACLAGIPVCTRAARRLGGQDDPGAIVLDEALALPLALVVVPGAERTPAILAAAFLIFRLFDIVKPFPCRVLERLHGGLGIMADDWGAAGWTAACLAVARWRGWV